MSLMPIASIIGGRGFVFGYFMMPDMFGGLLSMRIVGLAFGSGDQAVRSFAGAFATTCVQGALLNVLVFVVMAIAYGLQRAFRKPPIDAVRGFEVVPTIHAADADGPMSAEGSRTSEGPIESSEPA